MPQRSPLVQLLVLLVFGGVLAAGETTLLGGVVGVLGAAVALSAWALARRRVAAALRTSTGAGPAVSVRAWWAARLRAAPPRQQDPDAAGHTRARAPSALTPAV